MYIGPYATYHPQPFYDPNPQSPFRTMSPPMHDTGLAVPLGNGRSVQLSPTADLLTDVILTYYFFKESIFSDNSLSRSLSVPPSLS